MERTKISVEEYLENNELLKTYYTPFETKREIVDVIVSQVVEDKGMKKIDQTFLYRIATQVFIETITNIDMSIKSNSGLDGYDVLCLNDALNELIDMISTEFDRFDSILKLKLDDFYRYENSTSSILLSLKKNLSDFFKKKTDELNEMIANIDSKEISEKIKMTINENLKKYGGK